MKQGSRHYKETVVRKVYSLRQERILQVAAGIFANNGYGASPVRDIASAARVNEVTIFRQFKSKLALFRAAADYLAQQTQFLEKLDATCRQCDANAAQSIRAVVSTCLEICYEAPDLVGILKQALIENSSDQEVAYVFSEIERDYVQPLRIFVMDFSNASKPAGGGEMAGLMIYWTLLSLLSSHLDRNNNSSIRTTKSRDALAATLVDTWLNGVTNKSFPERQVHPEISNAPMAKGIRLLR